MHLMAVLSWFGTIHHAPRCRALLNERDLALCHVDKTFISTLLGRFSRTNVNDIVLWVGGGEGFRLIRMRNIGINSFKCTLWNIFDR